MPSTPLGPGTYAVFDFETTALRPGSDGRVIEVAVVSMRAEPVDLDGRSGLAFTVTDEWETLINPGAGVGVGATDIHHIEMSDVADAPSFEEVAGDLLWRLNSAVVVAHNASFDLGFLDYECSRLGVALPILASVCTRDLARGIAGAAGEPHRGFRLADCCERAGITFAEGDQHRSLGDTRVTAQLFAHLVGRATQLDLEVSTDVPPSPFLTPPPSGLSKPRGREVAGPTTDRGLF